MPPPRPLAGPDARILRLLTDGVSFDRTCDVGRHHRSWRPSDVHRVACTWLHPERHKASKPQHLPPAVSSTPVVYLTARRAHVLAELFAGRRAVDIAADLGLSTSAVGNLVAGLARDLGASNRRDALGLVRSGRVAVAVKIPRRR